RGKDGALSLGTCKRECNLSGETLRTDFSDSMALFLASAANHSTIMPSGINDFLVRVATRQSELFPPNPSATYDVTPPTITVVANTAVDEAPLSSSVGADSLPHFDGTAGTVSLDGASVAMFSRYASHFGPSDPGIPKWHFLVTDDKSDGQNIDVQAHLVRD